jgi:hypothetical protein
METNMSERIPRRALLLVATAVAAISAFAMSAAAASATEVVYSNIPAGIAGNYSSIGPEAYAYREFGGQMELAKTARNKPTVEVVMSSWGCQYGSWYANSCETPQPTKKFKWPITLNVYEVGEKNAVGEKLGSITKNFSMPYRPSDDPIKCPEGEGRYYSTTDKACRHGLAFRIKFPPLKVLRLPKRVIFGISYNTSHYGPTPAGNKTACYTKSAGCYYDSLNVGLAEESEKLLTTGANPAEPYIQSISSEMTCGDTSLETKFGETKCLTGYQPLFQITAH